VEKKENDILIKNWVWLGWVVDNHSLTIATAVNKKKTTCNRLKQLL
jgi:hypothetical protein